MPRRPVPPRPGSGRRSQPGSIARSEPGGPGGPGGPGEAGAETTRPNAGIAWNDGRPRPVVWTGAESQ